MNPDHWDKVGVLFDAALNLPETERERWLSESATTEGVRSEVASLLRSHRAAQGGGFVQDKIQQAVVSFQQLASGHAPIQTLGPYRLVRELGSGGMGVVYLAERDDGQYTSQVAIKLIRPGMDSEFIVARFRRERQTLARLQHPNIARLHDGGTTEAGLPYLVMEYIDGLSLSEYVHRHKLSTVDRLHLFLKICAAVDYAHRNFVIHRDIKPGNILVTAQGEPRLLDFGICKLLQNDPVSASETRAQMLTPDYASPEQISGNTITPLSDIYSLGVVLYELLSGCLPRNFHGLSIREIQEAASARIARPSECAVDRVAARMLQGDLDNIVLHTLEREPERRYQSAAMLADDLARYFAHEPVHARPPTRRYRLGKFLKRNAVLATAVCAVVLALGTGLAIALHEAHKANERLRQVQLLASKLVFEIHDSIAALPGATKAREMVLKTGAESLDTLAGSIAGDASAELDLARSFRRLGDVQGGGSGSNLGNSAAALASYRKSLALLDRAQAAGDNRGAPETERLILSEHIGALHIENGKFKEAAQTLDEAIGRSNAAPAESAEFKLALAGAYVESSDAKRNLNQWDAALHDSSAALKLGEDLRQTGTRTVAVEKAIADSSAAVGIVESYLGRFQNANAHFRQNAEALERLVAQEPANTAWKRELMLAYGHIADIAGNPAMGNQGDRAGALTMYRKAAEIGKSLHRSDPSDHRAAIDYGIVLSRVETVMSDVDVREKIAVQQESLNVMREAARTDPKNVLPVIYETLEMQHLGDSFKLVNQTDAALNMYRDATATARPLAQAKTATGLVLFIGAASRLARAYAAIGRRNQALQTAQETLDALKGMPAAATALTLPRADAAMGFTYADLSKSSARLPQDRKLAAGWLGKSVAAWRIAQTEKGFAAPHRREWNEAEAALKNLSGR